MQRDPLRVIVPLPDEAATVSLAEDVAACLAVGDVVALSGGLGAGKTTFARAVVRAMAGDPHLDVPSPTFTLVQTYRTERLALAHFDLYRLSSPEELEEVGLDEALADGAALVEWPERADTIIPAERLTVTFEIDGRGRRATITGVSNFGERLGRSRAIRAFLDTAGWLAARRRHLQGDASARRYERIAAGRGTAVLMDWPAGEWIDDRRANHRARDVATFVAVGNALATAGCSVPAVYAADYAQGLLLLEDFGSDSIARNGEPLPERYRLAVDVLAAIHSAPRPAVVARPDGGTHRLPVFSAGFATELGFFTDWYLPHVTGRPTDAAPGRELEEVWKGLTAHLPEAEASWLLLDYHSPNLLWLPERQGIASIGLLDFQDMHIGPSAYDVASLCQDARVTVPPELESVLRDHYVSRRRETNPAFDSAAFDEAYAILAAQRATKILGIFMRLATALGKRQYLDHFPRLRGYLARSLAHPALSGYAQWCEKYLPNIEGPLT